MQFSRHGIPEKLRTDNGPQYSSREFTSFCHTYGIEHHTSSPRYPQSNGEAERAVQTVKNLWMKCEDKYLALLDYRTTPLESCKLSPAQLSMCRRPRNKLPTHVSLLKPSAYDLNKVKQAMNEDKETQRYYYDKKAGKDKPVLVPGDPVRMSPFPGTKNWLPASVVAHHHSPRSYIVEYDGKKYRRNRKHLHLSTYKAYDRAPTLPLNMKYPDAKCPEHHNASQSAPRSLPNGKNTNIDNKTTKEATIPKTPQRTCSPMKSMTKERTPRQEIPVPKPRTPRKETPVPKPGAMNNEPKYVTKSGRAINPPKKFDI